MKPHGTTQVGIRTQELQLHSTSHVSESIQSATLATEHGRYSVFSEHSNILCMAR